MPATSSHECMITPPCTLPTMLASPMPIQRLRTELDEEGALGFRDNRVVGNRLSSSKEGGMPGLAGRMSTVIKAKVSRMLDRAEDPSRPSTTATRSRWSCFRNVKKGIADVVTSKKRLQMQSTKLEQQVVKLDTDARQALSQGREDLARMALERKTFQRRPSCSRSTPRSRARGSAGAAHRERAEAAPEDRAVPDQEEVIKAQYSAAEARVKISEAANGVGEQMADLGLAIQRAEDKTETMRARASAVEELEKAGTFDDLTQAQRRPGRASTASSRSSTAPRWTTSSRR